MSRSASMREIVIGWWKRPRTKTREAVETVGLALVLAFAARAAIAESRYVPTASMTPTIRENDRVLVEKVSYRLGGPQRGDVVVFDPPDPRLTGGDALIKRVVGLPGERISLVAGRVRVNGRLLDEPYAQSLATYPEPDWALLGMPGGVVPEGHVFVLGDNRNNSADSHVWGPLPVEKIIGQAVVRYWPFDRAGRLAGT